jgi:hypothetical protein
MNRLRTITRASAGRSMDQNYTKASETKPKTGPAPRRRWASRRAGKAPLHLASRESRQ